MPKVLFVGLVCVDVIQVCKSYPLEDSDQRSVDCKWRRGGNASNNATVFSLLGNDCEFFGTVSNHFFWEFVKKDFDANNVDVSHCVIHDGGYDFPFSTVLVNQQNGSRTIVHTNKNLPQATLNDFSKLDHTAYDVIHFEGRNRTLVEIRKMVEFLVEFNKNLPQKIICSMEIEKPGISDECLTIAALCDIVFISKDYATYKSWDSKFEAVQKLSEFLKPGATCIAAWGEYGAAAYNDDQGLVVSTSFPPELIVDTTGAGDTFLAATLHGILKTTNLQEAIEFGCRVAGAKIGRFGFDVAEEFRSFKFV